MPSCLRSCPMMRRQQQKRPTVTRQVGIATRCAAGSRALAGAGMAVAGAAGASNLHQDTQSCPCSTAAGPALLLAAQTAVDRPLEACSCIAPGLAPEPVLLQNFKWWRRRPHRRPPQRSPRACSRHARSGRSASRCDCLTGGDCAAQLACAPMPWFAPRLGQQLPNPRS